MAGKVRTVKAPSLKASIVDDVKEQIIAEVKDHVRDMRRDIEERDQYAMRRIEKLEDKNFEKESSRLSLSDWCMVGCYACIIVVVIIMTVRTLKKTSQYGNP